jgi:hypothetical protein
MKKFKLLMFIILMLTMITSVAAYDTWVRNSTLESGIKPIGIGNTFDKESLEIWEYGGNTYAIVLGETSTEIEGFIWNETTWSSSAVAKNGVTFSSSYYYNDPAIFEANGQIHMVLTESADVIIGFTWNGAGWTANNTVQNGIIDYGNSGSSDTFYYDDKVFIMVTGGSGGDYAYEWHDTVWVRNTTFEAGIDSIYNPTRFFYRLFDDLLMITIGTQDGQTTLHQSYIWNTTSSQWSRDDTIDAGIGNVGHGEGVIVEFDNKLTFFSSESSQYDSDRIVYQLPTNLAEKPQIVMIEQQRDNVPIFNTSFSLTHTTKTSFNCSLRESVTVLDSIENANVNTTYYLATTNLSLGINSYNLFCNDNEVEQTLNIQYDYDNSTPFINPISPSSFNTTLIGGSDSILFNVNISDGDLDKANYTIYYPNSTVFWNFQNLSIGLSEYVIETSIDISTAPDGDYIVHVEATDEQQIQDIGGLNPSEIYYQFEINNCNPDWNCTAYGDCTAFGFEICSEAQDLNSCGENISNYFAIQPIECTYTPPPSGSSSIFPTTIAPDQLDQEVEFTTIPGTSSTTFAIADLNVKMPEIINDIIRFFKELEWNDDTFKKNKQ